MTPERILANPPRILSQAAREAYFEHGYVMVEKLIDDEWIARLNALADEFLERSRAVTESDDVFDVAPSHTAARPVLRRLKIPDQYHEDFWRYATGVIADVAADLVGPDVVFHHSKLNFKWHDGSDEVKWHQDIQFYPHTNYSPLAIGTYLRDTTIADGAVAIIPGSHDGPLYDQYDAKGNWTGALRDEDVASLALDRAEYLEGPAGSITVHNCRAVHGSPPSETADGRPLLINAYTAADAFPYRPHPSKSAHSGEIVRGSPARWAYHDPRPCQIPPDWSGGYTSIFAAQSGEDAAAG